MKNQPFKRKIDNVGIHSFSKKRATSSLLVVVDLGRIDLCASFIFSCHDLFN